MARQRGLPHDRPSRPASSASAPSRITSFASAMGSRAANDLGASRPGMEKVHSMTARARGQRQPQPPRRTPLLHGRADVGAHRLPSGSARVSRQNADQRMTDPATSPATSPAAAPAT